MRAENEPKQQDLVLVGGGHSHVLVLRRLAMEPVAGLRVTVISREAHTPYSGMLPGLIAGHYSWDDIHIDLAPLCAAVGARLIVGTVYGLNVSDNALACDARPPIRFDVLSIDCGSAPATGRIEGADRVGIAVKPISRFLPRWQALLSRLRESGDENTKLAVVGGGAGGVELALAMHHRLERVEGLANVRLRLITADQRLLVDHNDGVRIRLEQELDRCGIEIFRDTRITAAEPGMLHASSGQTFEADEVLWVTEAGAQAWPADAGLAVNGGFIRVNHYLRSVSHAQVFAAGDIASMDGHTLAKAGVYAVRQGPILANNLISTVCGRSLRAYAPQRRFLSLISTGDRRAVVSRGEFAARGAWAWRWKDWIDRRFMERFRIDGEEMADIPPRYRVIGFADADDPEDMRCGGCGAKLGSDLLLRVLRRLNVGTSAEAVAGIGDDAAVLRPVANALEVQTVDGFRAMIDDPYLLGRIAAEHAMNDVYAMGGAPRTALAWVSVPYAAEALMEDDLFQLMAGAVGVFESAGASLVGGHSGEGGELSVGFAVSGTVDERDVWQRHRIAIGDCLVLTKPIGTGVLLAAHMRGRCRSAWLTGALACMQQSNRDAVSVLRRARVKGVTDVTGFGVLGHLGEMARAARLSVEIWPEAVPILSGAGELMVQGITSSLQAVNERALADIEPGEIPPDDTAVRMLLDPQTSGGLLAAVSADRVATCLDELHAAGFPQAAVIGRVAARRDDGFWGQLAAVDADAVAPNSDRRLA